MTRMVSSKLSRGEHGRRWGSLAGTFFWHHRLSGPAYEGDNGSKAWFVDGDLLASQWADNPQAKSFDSIAHFPGYEAIP